MKDTDIAYAAGFVDGEGSISIELVGQARTPAVFVKIANCDLPVLERLRSQFGGRIKTLRRVKDPKPQNRESYQLVIAWDYAIDFIKLIRPYLVVKTKQADVALEWNAKRNRSRGGQVGKKGRPRSEPKLTEEYRQQMQDLRSRMASLNKKGSGRTALGDAASHAG